jgi:hypothetical protein
VPQPDPPPEPFADNRRESPTGLPLSHAAGILQARGPQQAVDNRRLQGTSVDISVRPQDRLEHIIDIDPPATLAEPGQPSTSRVGRTVSDQLAIVAQSVLPLRQVVSSLQPQTQAVPPGELAVRLNQRFDQYI